MKIALLIKRFDPTCGGAENWTWQLACWLAGEGHQVHAVASRFTEEAPRRGIICHAVPKVSSPLAWAAAAEEVLKPLRGRFDVVHDMGQSWCGDVFQPHSGSLIAAFKHSLLSQPRWLRLWKRGVAHVLPRYRTFRRLLQRQYDNDPRTVIAVSRMVARHMSLLHGVSEARLRIVYNGVDVERFSPEHRRKHRDAVRRQLGVGDKPLLFMAAHNFQLKGVPTLLRATALLLRQGQRLHVAIAGHKGVKPAHRLAQQLGAAAAVSFVGSQPDIVPYYAAADVYVQPTFYDPCSLVVLEALASGVPVITSRCNGAAELMRHGREGYIIDSPGDHRALAEAIARLLDPAVRAPMETAARELAESHTFARNGRGILAAYEATAHKRRRAA
jgi:UDP-glucose:(heptosyl)LPS alpha-1,3-glucosyltransferase